MSELDAYLYLYHFYSMLRYIYFHILTQDGSIRSEDLGGHGLHQETEESQRLLSVQKIPSVSLAEMCRLNHHQADTNQLTLDRSLLSYMDLLHGAVVKTKQGNTHKTRDTKPG